MENVLLRNGRQLADVMFHQMMQHYQETPLGEDDCEVKVTRGFGLLQPQLLNVSPGQRARDFRQAVSPASDTRKQVFGGFGKCCYLLQRFDSDPERRFAVLIDSESAVEKWIKPGRTQFQIEYRSGDSYEPDCVVETRDRVLICEVKAQHELTDPVVLAKAQAAVKWCQAATQHATECGGKPWSYLLIPDGRSRYVARPGRNLPQDLMMRAERLIARPDHRFSIVPQKACRRAPRQAVGVHPDAQRPLRQRRFIACGARAVPVTRVRLPAGRALR